MKKIFTLALLAFAISASAQEILINKTDGTVMDHMSLMELCKATHISDADGNNQMKVELRNGATYTCDVNEIENASITTKDDMLKNGRFADMELVKTFNSIQELEEGDLVGIVDESDYDYDGFFNEAYGALNGTSTNPIMSQIDPETLSSLRTALNAAFQANLYALAFKNSISYTSIRFHITDIVYVGRDIDGTMIPLSARLIYPYCTDGVSHLSITKMYVEQHTTLFEDDMEPSAAFYPFSCSGVVFKGYMILQPDLLGFGISKMRSQLFIDRDVNGAATADCVIAAKQYVNLAWNTRKYKIANLSSEATIISAGSSQGASTALGFTYYMENMLPTEIAANLPKVTENHLCAGAYTPRETLDEFVRCDSISGFLVPVILSTASTGYPELMRDHKGKLILPYELLDPKLKDMTWNDMEDQGVPANMTIWQMLNCMKGNMTAFSQMFKKEFPYDPNPYYASFKKIMAEGIVKTDAQGHNYLNYDDERIEALERYYDANELTDPLLWVPNSDISMFHSTNDAIVPFINSKVFYNNMYDLMQFKGKTLTLEEYDNPSNLNHVMICLVWMMSEVTGLSMDSILSIMTSM